MRRNDNLPHIRTVDALQGNHTGDTKALFRALSEADDFIHAREQRDEATVRLQELEAENRDLRAENEILKTELEQRRVAGHA